MAIKKKKKSKLLKPISLWPLKPEDALKAFMNINPEKVLMAERKMQLKKIK